MTYGVAGGILLLRGQDGAAALGCIEGCLSADYGLALTPGAASLASDLGDLIPVVRHFEGVVVGGAVRMSLVEITSLL